MVLERAQTDGVVTLTLNRPEVLNALDDQLIAALSDAFTSIPHEPSARVVILQGAGERAFCAGADLKARRGMPLPAWQRQHDRIAALARAVLDCPLPTIAAVHGYALGGGCELALLCDLLLAADDAQFGMPETSLGIIPGLGGTQTLPRRLGVQRAKWLIFTGERISAAEALRLGLVLEVVPRAALRERAQALARRIAANSPLALRQAKRAIDLGLDLDLRSGLALEEEAYHRCLYSADREEGMRAFAERRSPRFTGE